MLNKRKHNFKLEESVTFSKKKRMEPDDLSELGFIAIEENDVNKLKSLLRKGLSPNAENKEKETLLFSAISFLNPEMIGLILKAGADPNKPSASLSTISVDNEALELTANIEEHNIKENHPEDINSNQVVFEMENQTPIMLAVTLDNDEKELKDLVIDLLIAYKADINKAESKNGFTPLHLAANANDFDMIEKLAKNGADVNAIALKEYTRKENMLYNSNVTPLLLAVNSENQTDSSKSIDTLLKNGADIGLNKNAPVHIGSIIRALSWSNYVKAEKLFVNVIDEDLKKLSYKSIQDKVDTFILRNSTKDSDLDDCVEKILFKGVENKKQSNYVIYYSHLNSWVGDLSGIVEKKHNKIEAEGWMGFLQTPVKIKSMLILLKGVEAGKINCETAFNEPKEKIVKKLRDEIFNQTSTYYSDAHTEMIQSLSEDITKKSPLEFNANVYTAKKWAEMIGNLKDGESFCIAASTLDHGMYIEFKKQENSQEISRYLYNLGGGADTFHLNSSDNKIFPHVAKDIPQELFKSKDYAAIDYLINIVDADKTIVSDGDELTEGFKKLYNKPFETLNAQSLNSVEGLVPSKAQVAGNCSFKNNLSAINNRFQNSKLFSALKNVEKAFILAHVNIPLELIKKKEMEKDIKSIDAMISTHDVENPKAKTLVIEKELFRFLEKRSNKIPEDIRNKAGERIAYAINNMKEPVAFDFYVSNKPELIKHLKRIAKNYKSKNLMNIADSFSKKYEITSDLFIKGINSSNDNYGVRNMDF